jgi:hypothetical protein
VQPSPTTALIALLGSAAGSLTGWYTPALIPGLIFGVLAYAGVVLGLARAFGIDRDRALIETSRCILLAAAVTLQVILRGAINLLNALDRWSSHLSLNRTGATAP